jgi:hypothetical protein
MKKPKNTQKKVTMDSLTELGRRYGVKVTDMSERGVRAVGFLAGARRKHQKPENIKFVTALAFS